LFSGTWDFAWIYTWFLKLFQCCERRFYLLTLFQRHFWGFVNKTGRLCSLGIRALIFWSSELRIVSSCLLCRTVFIVCLVSKNSGSCVED
jgi:hypothetical protein